jgi:hypothetical protein
MRETDPKVHSETTFAPEVHREARFLGDPVERLVGRCFMTRTRFWATPIGG